MRDLWVHFLQRITMRFVCYSNQPPYLEQGERHCFHFLNRYGYFASTPHAVFQRASICSNTTTYISSFEFFSLKVVPEILALCNGAILNTQFTERRKDYGISLKIRRGYEGVSKSFRTGRLERELQIVQLSATRGSFIAIL